MEAIFAASFHFAASACVFYPCSALDGVLHCRRETPSAVTLLQQHRFTTATTNNIAHRCQRTSTPNPVLLRLFAPSRY
jgi:hypothetical protein